MFDSTPKTRHDFIKGAIVINILFLVLGALATLGHARFSSELRDGIESGMPLIVFQLQQSVLLFAWIPVVSGLVVINIQMIFVKILQRPIPSLLLRVKKLATWTLFAGVAFFAFGSQVTNPTWKDRLPEASYTRCETQLLDLGKSFFNEVWVKDADDCHDPELRKMLVQDNSRRGVVRAQHYLKQKHAFLEDYRAGG